MKRSKKKTNKILIKNLPVFGILSKQEAAADSQPDGDEAERKQRGQIMENQDGDGDGRRWRHFHCIKIMKNLQIGSVQSGNEKAKPGEARRGDLKHEACYHLQLNASTLGRPRSLRENTKRETKKPNKNVKLKVYQSRAEQSRSEKPNSITNWTVSSSCRRRATTQADGGGGRGRLS